MKRFCIPAGIACAAIASPVLAQSGGDGWYGHPHMGGYDGWGMVLGPILWLIVLGLIVVGVVWFVRMLGPMSPPAHGGGPRHDDALTVLRARYARGEIDNDEFDERRKRLET